MISQLILNCMSIMIQQQGCKVSSHYLRIKFDFWNKPLLLIHPERMQIELGIAADIGYIL